MVCVSMIPTIQKNKRKLEKSSALLSLTLSVQRTRLSLTSTVRGKIRDRPSI